MERKVLTLYRADRKGNQTMPERYYSDGLLTKQLGSGDDPEPHKKYGWLKTVLSHINYGDELSKFIYDTTAFLSFTTEMDNAMYFLTHSYKDKFAATDRNEADGYIFTAQFDCSEMKEIGPGIYLYTYSCNYEKLRTDAKFQTLLPCGCNICGNSSNARHGLILIDAPRYLHALKDTFPIEYGYSKGDNEWLLLPIDPMLPPYPVGWQSRIQIADFWTVDFYKFIG
jgi:hypothetical protein